jgi:hypothetical protein
LKSNKTNPSTIKNIGIDVSTGQLLIFETPNGLEDLGYIINYQTILRFQKIWIPCEIIRTGTMLNITIVNIPKVDLA